MVLLVFVESKQLFKQQFKKLQNLTKKASF